MFDKRIRNCFTVFREKDSNMASLFLELIKEERERCINSLLTAEKWDDVRFLQGSIYILNQLISILEGKNEW